MYQTDHLLTHSEILLSSRTPLLSFTLLSPIIGAIKVIFLLLIVESSFHRVETKHHHHHLIDETCGWPPPATYHFRNKCQASERKNSNFLHPGIRSKYRISRPMTFIFGVETVITNQPIPSDDGQHPAAAFNFAMAAASRHAHAKRTSRTPVTAQPRWSFSPASRPTGDGKRQKTASAHEDLLHTFFKKPIIYNRVPILIIGFFIWEIR